MATSSDELPAASSTNRLALPELSNPSKNSCPFAAAKLAGLMPLNPALATATWPVPAAVPSVVHKFRWPDGLTAAK